MVDFSKLQKISNIARELMKHGQANSMDEAMRIASEQVENGTVPEYMETTPATPTASIEVPTMESVSNDNVSNDNVSNDNVSSENASAEVQVEQTVAPADADLQRVTHIINQQQSTIAKLSTVLNVHTNQLNEVAGLKTKFNQLLKELTELKEEVGKIKRSPMTPAPSASGQTTFKAPKTAAPEQPASPPTKPQGTGHARSGNYVSDDVSIEKFFYFGGK